MYMWYMLERVNTMTSDDIRPGDLLCWSRMSWLVLASNERVSRLTCLDHHSSIVYLSVQKIYIIVDDLFDRDESFMFFRDELKVVRVK